MEHHTLGCVIFDLDGTLLDSMNVWSQIDRNLLNHYGKTAPDDLTEQVKKMTIQQSAQYFIDRFQLPCQPEYAATETGRFPAVGLAGCSKRPLLCRNGNLSRFSRSCFKATASLGADCVFDDRAGNWCWKITANDLPAGCQPDGLWQTANGCCRRCCTRHRNRCDRWIFHGWRL